MCFQAQAYSQAIFVATAGKVSSTGAITRNMEEFILERNLTNVRLAGKNLAIHHHLRGIKLSILVMQSNNVGIQRGDVEQFYFQFRNFTIMVYYNKFI